MTATVTLQDPRFDFAATTTVDKLVGQTYADPTGETAARRADRGRTTGGAA